jgi:hypothetical protein
MMAAGKICVYSESGSDESVDGAEAPGQNQALL